MCYNRRMTATSKTEWLARAQAMQTIESNPLTAEEVAQLEAWEAEGLTGEQMRRRLREMLQELPAAAAE